MVNINITVPDELHKKIKLKCVTDEITLKQFVVDCLESKIKEELEK